MAITFRPTELVLEDARYLLREFRFSFENAKIQLEYKMLEHEYELAAMGLVFTLRIKMNADWNDNLKYYNSWNFYKSIGLIPVWDDPIC